MRQGVRNIFDNIGMPRRALNNLFQAKFKGMGRETTRFLLNSTVGVAGFFDVGKTWGIEKSDEDSGQTLAVYGVSPGPYLILPFMPSLTVRDAFGAIIDQAMNPLLYVSPFLGFTGIIRGGQTVNERSLTLKFYQEVEESGQNLYKAVRTRYLQRRERAIKE